MELETGWMSNESRDAFVTRRIPRLPVSSVS